MKDNERKEKGSWIDHPMINEANKVIQKIQGKGGDSSMSPAKHFMSMKNITDTIRNIAIEKDVSNLSKLVEHINISAVNPFHMYEGKVSKVKNEINETENRLRALLYELKTNQYGNEELKLKLKEIESSELELKEKHELVFLASRIHPDAVDVLLEDDSILLKNFTNGESKKMTVISIDIRRSTELMLKTISHDDYADFISNLIEELKRIIIENYGVFDKFTGDGVLAYFPEFYSGSGAIVRCLLCSAQCHEYFKEYYKKNASKFSVVIKTGLGIGVDYGEAKIVSINEEQTIVGNPVVYACRLSNAPANHTYLNASVLKQTRKMGEHIEYKEVELDIKNEGTAIVYDLIDMKCHEPERPRWT